MSNDDASPKLSPRKEVQTSVRLPHVQSPKICAAVEKSSARQEGARCRLGANPKWEPKFLPLFRILRNLTVTGYPQNKDLKLPIWKAIEATGISLRASEFSEVSVQGDVVKRDQTFKKLVILDLNGVLVRAYPRGQTINISKRPSMLLKYKQ
ncbi:hypothetical protein KI387_021607, partial [Taxus chinensis]